MKKADLSNLNYLATVSSKRRNLMRNILNLCDCVMQAENVRDEFIADLLNSCETIFSQFTE